MHATKRRHLLNAYYVSMCFLTTIQKGTAGKALSCT